MNRPGRSSFRPGRALTVQVAAALVTTVALATWQITRAMDKTALVRTHEAQLGAQPVDASRYSARTPDFTRLSLTGRYDPQRLFRVAERPGARGFGVVSALTTDGGAFLVNRGWTFGSPKEFKPETPTGPVSVVGVVWPTAPLPPAIHGETWPKGWPKTVRAVDAQRMADALGVHPREIRLEAGGIGVFRAASLAWDYSPGQHWSYAVQWLLIGTAVGVGYVLIGRRRGRQAGDDA